MKYFLALLLIGVTTCALGQAQAPQAQATTPVPDNRVIRKIKIKHADPYLIYLLLLGRTTAVTPPEPTAIKQHG